jgi:hypothetical protein
MSLRAKIDVLVVTLAFAGIWGLALNVVAVHRHCKEQANRAKQVHTPLVLVGRTAPR